MKKHILFLVLCVFGGLLTAQENETGYDSETVTKLKKSDRIMLDLYYDIWQGVPSNVTLKTIQPGITFSSVQDYPIGNSNFAVSLGAAISVHNLHWNAQIPIDTSAITQLIILKNDSNYKVNKFTLSYLEVPFEIRFRTKGVNTFRVYAGFKYGILLQEHTKFVGDDPYSDNEIKFKEYKHKNVSRYTFGPTLRIGYKWVNLYAAYSMVPIFQKDKGPQMYPISVGISVIPY